MSLGAHVRLRQDATWLAHVYHNLVIVHVCLWSFAPDLDFTWKFSIIWRTNTKCAAKVTETCSVLALTSLEFVFWNEISKIPDGCFCAQDFISFWIFHLIYWIKVELCKGPLPALLVQKALVVHYTMTNATLPLNTPTLKKDDSGIFSFGFMEN